MVEVGLTRRSDLTRDITPRSGPSGLVQPAHHTIVTRAGSGSGAVTSGGCSGGNGSCFGVPQACHDNSPTVRTIVLPLVLVRSAAKSWLITPLNHSSGITGCRTRSESAVSTRYCFSCSGSVAMMVCVCVCVLMRSMALGMQHQVYDGGSTTPLPLLWRNLLRQVPVKAQRLPRLRAVSRKDRGMFMCSAGAQVDLRGGRQYHPMLTIAAMLVAGQGHFAPNEERTQSQGERGNL